MNGPEGVHIPYENSEGTEINLSEKRMAFWTETVPEEIRRYEYELWKRYRDIFLIKQHRQKAAQISVRTDFVEPYTDEVQDKSWDKFRSSFLFGEKRKEKFNRIVDISSDYSKKFINKISEQTGEDFESEILLTAIGGSSFYGPRKDGEELSDIDLYYLVNDQGTESNFEILPQRFNKPEVHIIGTGYQDGSRLEREQIHWLLYPHYPLTNKLSNDKLKEVIQSMVESTTKRKGEIEAEIDRLDKRIDGMRM